MDRSDLCTLENLNDNNVLESLEDRYKKDMIYTNAGIVLLALNPNKSLSIYGKNVMHAYFNKIGSAEPHIYEVAETTYQDLNIFGNQTIIISGESGSGKTESAKLILDYLVERSKSCSSIQEKITSANVILESFGNATTKLNKNSSRFGKRIKLLFEGSINGTVIETYLLEKSRVTHQESNEKNFHVFYQLCAYKNLSIKNDYIDTTGIDLEHYKEQYQKTREAMIKVGVKNIEEIENALLGILYLGYTKFSSDGTLKVVNDENFKKFCSLLSIDENKFSENLIQYKIKVRGEIIEGYNTLKQATTIRNSTARLLYSSIFDYLTNAINESMKGNGGMEISILDIFGFEVFENNGLDQLCINWTNEKIQNEFIKRIFEEKQRMYVDEGIEWNSVTYETNDECLNEFEKPCGIVDLINEESFNAWGNVKNLGIKIKNYIQGGIRMKNDDVMVVNHYAGTVEYDLIMFLEKNREKGNLNMFNCTFILPKENHEGLVKYFKESMNALFNSINQTQIKYIRCIKPGTEAGAFNTESVYKQLKECGVIETIKISRQSLPREMEKAAFEGRYGAIDKNILQFFILKEGHTKFFIKNIEMLELHRIAFFEENSRVLKKTLKKYVTDLINEKTKLKEKEKIKRELEKELENENLEEKDKIKIELENEDSEEQITKEIEKEVTVTFEDKVSLGKNISEAEELSFNSDVIKTKIARQLKIADKYGDLSYEEIIEDLEAKIEQYKKFCADPCRNCKTLELKYKFQCEALKKKNMVEIELEKYKSKVDYLEQQLMKKEKVDEEPSDDDVSYTNGYNVYECLIQLFLEYSPAFSDLELPKSEILAFAHSAYHVATKLKTVEQGTGCMVEEIISLVKSFEGNIHKVLYILSNLIEYKAILLNSEIQHHTDLDCIIKVLFKHLCEMQRSSILELLPHSVLDHQPLQKFKCHDGYFKRIFKPTSIDKLIRMLEYFYHQMSYYYFPEEYIFESVNYMLKTINTSVFNGLLVKKNFLSFNRSVQINYNVNEIEKFCRSINYVEGMLNLEHTISIIKLINLVEGKASADTILNECSILNCTQIKEIISKFEKPVVYTFCEDSKHERFLVEPTITMPVLESPSEYGFVCPRYLPSTGLMKIFKTVK